MIKLVIFDLDGVLVDSKDTHYKALNLALEEVDKKYIISYDDHIKKYDGLPTNKKLEKLTYEKGLSKELYKQIWEQKQKYTFDVIKSDIKENNQIINLFQHLKNQNLMIWVASNSIRQTIKLYLLKLGLMEYVDGIISNEDIQHPKPHPEMYMKCMVLNHISPNETVVVEDSHVGITAAIESGANVCIVKNSSETTIEKLSNFINNIHIPKIKWKATDMNILIPMAGEGSRFKVAGYTFPKPLIEIHGKTMIETVVRNINIDGTYIYVVRKEHYEKYNLKQMLEVITPGCKVITIDYLTEGAACTTLLAKEIINNDKPLLIANSDQFMEWNSSEFMYSVSARNCDGSILTFQNTHPKWSYVKLNEDAYVTEVKEKEVISDIATVGVYYYKKGSDYVKYAEQMIQKDIRVGQSFNGKGEFYVAPVYNEAIQDGKKIKIFNVDKLWGLGTPEDLTYFLQNYKGDI